MGLGLRLADREPETSILAPLDLSWLLLFCRLAFEDFWHPQALPGKNWPPGRHFLGLTAHRGFYPFVVEAGSSARAAIS